MTADDITVIGITGSIGMGKSTVATMLREMGVPVHDSDAAVHILLAPKGKAVATVGQAFPQALKKDENGESYIDRPTLGQIVFVDCEKKKQLEEILHPLVQAESGDFIAEMKKQGHDIVALDIPLLFETGGENRVDVTVVVSAPKEIQRERVLARPGMTSEKFERIVAKQLPDAEKRKRADYIVETDKSLDAVRAQVKKIVDKAHPVKK